MLNWKGKQYEKILLIENHDTRAGFCALIVYALNGVRRAESMNAIPVIDFNGNNTVDYYDETIGSSVWDYFFEPLSPFSAEQIKNWLASGQLSKTAVRAISAKDFGFAHHYDPDRLATFWAWEEPKNKEQWMREKRKLGRQYIKEYVVPKKHITHQVKDYYSANFDGFTMFGLHIRGTDFDYATLITIDSYTQELDRLIATVGESDYKIFVATDQQQYLEHFIDKYGERVVYRDAARSSGSIAPFKLDGVSGYRKGEDALLDILLLSRCHHIIKGPAALGEMGLWFCEHNNITDFALQSQFFAKPYSQLKSAYFSLNIGNDNKRQLKLLRRKEKLIKHLLSMKIVTLLYKHFECVRRWLRC